MKALLLSIRPEHAYNIITGKKTLELRKSVPKGFKGWVYVYVTEGKPRLSVVHDDENGKTYYYLNSNWGRELNGTIPFRFCFDEWEEVPRTDYTKKQSDTGLIPMMKSNGERYYERMVVNLREGYEYDDCEGSCLTNAEIKAYGKGKDLYAWHIKKLEIFDKPMQLGEFYKTKGKYLQDYERAVLDYKNRLIESESTLKKISITKAPQSYMFVYVKDELK